MCIEQCCIQYGDSYREKCSDCPVLYSSSIPCGFIIKQNNGYMTCHGNAGGIALRLEAGKCSDVRDLERRSAVWCNTVQKPLGNNNSLIRNKEDREGLTVSGVDCAHAFTHSQRVRLQSGGVRKANRCWDLNGQVTGCNVAPHESLCLAGLRRQPSSMYEMHGLKKKSCLDSFVIVLINVVIILTV